MKLSLFLAVGAAAALLLSGATASANESGAALFETCRSCHALQESAETMPGPNLKGLLGRSVAGDESFDYSPVLRAAGFAGEVWTREKLEQFLADPEAMFPGMWMTGQPLRDPDARKALADFIADPESR